MEFSRIIDQRGQGEFHMKRKRFSETQIIQILNEADAGVAAPDSTPPGDQLHMTGEFNG